MSVGGEAGARGARGEWGSRVAHPSCCFGYCEGEAGGEGEGKEEKERERRREGRRGEGGGEGRGGEGRGGKGRERRREEEGASHPQKETTVQYVSGSGSSSPVLCVPDCEDPWP